MTREMAIKAIQDFIGWFKEDSLIRKALEMAIKALSQEPCDDAISREELLKAIDTWDKFGYTETGCFVREPKGDYVPYIHYVDVIKCIKGMPSVTQKSGKWIPVSERLPEDRRTVFVTAYWHETYQVMMASYYGDGLWWCVPFNNCGEHMQRLNPKAWMPLPEPYKAESEEV